MRTCSHMDEYCNNINYYYAGNPDLHHPVSIPVFNLSAKAKAYHGIKRTFLGKTILENPNPEKITISRNVKFPGHPSISASCYLYPRGLEDDYNGFSTLEICLTFQSRTWGSESDNRLESCVCKVSISVKVNERHPSNASLVGLPLPTISAYLNEEEKKNLKAHILVKKAIDLKKIWQSTTCPSHIDMETSIHLKIWKSITPIECTCTDSNTDNELVIINTKPP